ncbi:cation:proton antiporter [Cysteiniphilum sp. JM-1]|uniref:cation:proton antiporter n=1 Tax=Cysteiniphilum sp. JM-1 TaxID=2610891 RepID=UPI00124821E0|nr:sodium:proton antiporter [Cysteiniphilum sp. JM-1]
MHLLFSMLVIITALSSYINLKVLKLDKSIGLIIISLVISIVTMGALHFHPDEIAPIVNILSGVDFKTTVLEIMLGYLLFAAAMNINTVDLHRVFGAVLYMASIGVIVTTFIVGFVLYWVVSFFGFDLSLGYCLIFAALISPTDPIAVISVFKSASKVPQAIKTKVTGESLFNDAVGILMFVVLLNVFGLNSEAGFNFGVKEVVLEILHEAGGGVLFGYVIGRLGAFLLRRVDDSEVCLYITLGIASAGFVIAESLGLSAPIAMVIAGLVIGSFCRKDKFTQKTTQSLLTFWHIIEEILISFLFVLIGLEVFSIKFEVSYLILGIITIAIILGARYISIFIPYATVNYARKRGLPQKEMLLITWGGIRGGISIALALSLTRAPDLLITLTYIVVVLSILVQGGSFKFLINKTYKRS